LQESTRPADSADLERRAKAYWKENLRLIVILLVIWFAVSYVPAFFAEALNNIKFLTGFPLGYYMGSQGSLIVFVILIFYYSYAMTKLEAKYGIREDF
jgi:putative solute:sodium symporter small subunit